MWKFLAKLEQIRSRSRSLIRFKKISAPGAEKKDVTRDLSAFICSGFKHKMSDIVFSRYVFGTRMIQLLYNLEKTLHQFNHALSTCSVETLLRVGTLHPEMSVHEKGLDFYIDLLHKGQLDENITVNNLEKTLNYFDTIYPMYLQVGLSILVT